MRSESSTDGQQRRSFIEEARRRQIVAAAVEVISEVGYGSASLARIAAQAGVSKGVVSYHFKGKDELMAQLVIQLYAAGWEQVASAVRAVGSNPRDQLLTYIDSNLAFIDGNRKSMAALTDVIVNLRDSKGRLCFGAADGDRELIRPLVDILGTGQKAGVFGQFEAALMAKSIRDSIDGAAGRAVRDPAFDMPVYSAHLCRVYDLATRGEFG